MRSGSVSSLELTGEFSAANKDLNGTALWLLFGRSALSKPETAANKQAGVLAASASAASSDAVGAISRDELYDARPVRAASPCYTRCSLAPMICLSTIDRDAIARTKAATAPSQLPFPLAADCALRRRHDCANSGYHRVLPKRIAPIRCMQVCEISPNSVETNSVFVTFVVLVVCCRE